MPQNKFTEETVEEAALAWLRELGYETLHAPDIERERYDEVFLEDKLRAALQTINPNIPADILDDVYRRVAVSTRPGLVDDNYFLHKTIVNGADVEYENADGETRGDKAWLIDFKTPEKNAFCAVSQFKVVEGQKNRRPDIVLFVNGMPLAVLELKSLADENADLQSAFNQLQTYQKDIPSLFRANAVLAVSDGIKARYGALGAGKERLMPWRTLDGENINAKGAPELETLLRGLFNKESFLDFVQNFIVFEKDGPNIVKKIAACHQFHAVNKAVERAAQSSAAGGDKRAGVIWHTQGSGKSLSMAFYAAKIIRCAAMKNPTLLMLTDRNDLDDQLFSTFCRCQDLLRQTPKQAESREHLKDLLMVAAGGVVFSTIQKFAAEKGEKYPLLSDRRNIVVIADEAHRSQYEFIDGFARRIREALPNASFIGFTATPIALAEKDTQAVFGKTIHAYDIQQAVDEKAIVATYYESRLAKVKLNEELKPFLDEQFEEITESEEEDKKSKLKNRWASLEALAGAEKRVQSIAKDLVAHLEARLDELEGKAMAVCMSRRICVDLYDAIAKLRPHWHDSDDDKGEMKIVMSGAASDEARFQPHIRNKSGRAHMARRAKDPNDPLKLVIVRDMWLTGFDSPPMHTMYVDKFMRGHNLMQAIARVNRIFKDKPHGLVADYLGIANSLKVALNYYTQKDHDNIGVPQEKAIAMMMEKYGVIRQLLHNFDYAPALNGAPEEQMRTIAAAMNHILSLKNGRARFMRASLDLFRAFALCVASDEAAAIRDEAGFFKAVRGALAKTTAGERKDSEEINTLLKRLISQAVASSEVVNIFAAAGLKTAKISILSDEFLAEMQGMKYQNLALAMLQKLLRGEIKERAQKNVVQARNFAEKLDEIMRKYRRRLIETAQVIDELIRLAKEMRAAQSKGQKLGLSDDEIAFYDALADNESAREAMKDELLRDIARELAVKIRESTTIDWTMREQVRAKMRVMVRRILKKYGYPPDMREKATKTVMEQAELLCADLAA